jgi:hypothetical protein
MRDLLLGIITNLDLLYQDHAPLWEMSEVTTYNEIKKALED